MRIKYFINYDLDISDSSLQYMKWEELVERIISFYNTTYRFSIEEPTAHEIHSRIMRRDNFLISLFNQEKIIDLRPFYFMNPILSESLLWNLRLIIKNMFTNFRLNNMVNYPNQLRNYILFLGIVNLVLSPFIFLFVIMRGIFKYAAMIHKSNTSFIVERRWTKLAEWRFRDFNELPHQFQFRMNQAYKPANDYVIQFPNYILSILSKIIVSFTSSYAALLIILLFILKENSTSDKIGVDYYTFGFNPIAFLSALLIIWTVSRGFVIEKNSNFNPNKYMIEIAQYTHHFPKDWRNMAHTKEVFDKFTNFFQPTYMEFIQELLSIFTTPFILIFILSRKAKKISDFMNQIAAHDEKMGDVCGLATFDFNKFETSSVQATFLSPSNELKVHIPQESMNKMERSFLRFKVEYPKSKLGTEKIKELEKSILERSIPSSNETTPIHNSIHNSFNSIQNNNNFNNNYTLDQSINKTNNLVHPVDVQAKYENLPEVIKYTELLQSHQSLPHSSMMMSRF